MILRFAAVLALGFALPACVLAPPRSPDTSMATSGRPPRMVFADPERRAKLARGFPDVDALVRAEAKEGGIASIAVGVVIDGELAHFSGAGFANLETKTPPDADTVYRIASMTKSFTALAILALRDDGALRLDDPLSRFIPQAAKVVAPTADSPPITIRDLLRHTSGLPRSGRFEIMGVPRFTEDVITSSLDGYALEEVPGMRVLYSNLGFQLLGIVVHRASGEPLRSFLARRLFEPLGMTATSFDGSKLAPGGARAIGYDRDDDGVEQPVHEGDHGAAEGAGGIFTSVRDMARYLAMHTGAYPPRDDPEGPAIRRSSLREAHLDGRRVTPTSIHMREGAARGEPIVTEWDDHYAYGIAVHQSCEFEDFTVHNGGLPGWSSAMGFLPRHGVAVVALTNQGRKGRDPTGLVERVLLTLAKTGGLAPRVAVPTASRAVEAAMSRLAAIYDRWSPTAYHAMLSSHRGPVTEEEERQELAGYKELHGACGAFTAVEVKGPLEARFGARCERGVLEMSVVVDPDGLVTGFVGTSRGVRPSAEVGLAAERLASLVARWEDAVFDAVIPDGGAPRAEHAAAFAKLRAAHGTCIVASYDKLPEAHRFALSCKRGPALQLDLKLRREDRTIASYAFHEAQPGGPCPVRP